MTKATSVAVIQSWFFWQIYFKKLMFVCLDNFLNTPILGGFPDVGHDLLSLPS